MPSDACVRIWMDDLMLLHEEVSGTDVPDDTQDDESPEVTSQTTGANDTRDEKGTDFSEIERIDKQLEELDKELEEFDREFDRLFKDFL